MEPFIRTEKLNGYTEPMNVDDYYIETVDKKYALYLYNIREVTMMNYFANLSIFSENKFDNPLLSSGKVRIGYDNSKTFTYAQKSGCLIFIMGARPYLLIKPKTSQFSFIDWDITSGFYSLEEVSENVLVVKEKNIYPEGLARLTSVQRTGEVINLTELAWYDFAQFDNALEIYLNR